MKEKIFNLFEFIRESINSTGKAPTFSEMVEFAKVKSKQTIEDWLRILENEDLIFRNNAEQRTISLTKKGEVLPVFKKFVPENQITGLCFLTQLQNTVNNISVSNTISYGSYGETKLEVDNVNLYRTKGGENNGTT